MPHDAVLAEEALRPAARPGFLKLFGVITLKGVAYAPAALGLAFACAGLTAVLVVASNLLGPQTAPALAPVLIALAHALFIVFLWALIGQTTGSAGRRIEYAIQTTLRGVLPFGAMLCLSAWLAANAGPWTPDVWAFGPPAGWAVTTFFSLPAHFARFGWRGWITLPRRPGASILSRLVLMAPTLLVLTPLCRVLSNTDMGIMDGGIVAIPVLGAVAFWSAYSCAVFTSQFSPPEVETCPYPQSPAQ